MSKVKDLLIDQWGLFRPQRPHLALSLIGGAKNFRMEGRKREIFKAGLITAAKSTNALILTGGSNAGTMKLVGEAVKEGQFMVQVRLMGEAAKSRPVYGSAKADGRGSQRRPFYGSGLCTCSVK